MTKFLKSKNFFILLFFPLILSAIAAVSCEASNETKAGDWEERFNALEKRVGELETENHELRQELGTLKAQRESQGVSPAVPLDKVTTLEERVTKVEKGLSKQVQIGVGSLKISGLLQGWYVIDQDANDRFRLRRSEIKFGGKIAEEQPIVSPNSSMPASTTVSRPSSEELLTNATTLFPGLS